MKTFYEKNNRKLKLSIYSAFDFDGASKGFFAVFITAAVVD